MQKEEVKFKDILAIAGKPGLYQFISQARNGIVVEAFADGKRMAVQSTTKVSALEDIAIYTETEEIPLKEVFASMIEKLEGKTAVSHKSNPEELKKLFSEILPDYDKDRVYISDIKKVINWYNILKEADLFSKGILDSDEEEAAEEEKTEEEQAEPSTSKENKKESKE